MRGGADSAPPPPPPPPDMNRVKLLSEEENQYCKR